MKDTKTHHCRLSLVWDDKRVLAVVHDSNDPEPSPEERANAQLIVKAVNCHEELLAACRRAAPWLGKMIADGNHKGCVMPNDCERTLQLLEAAINKAQS